MRSLNSSSGGSKRSLIIHNISKSTNGMVFIYRKLKTCQAMNFLTSFAGFKRSQIIHNTSNSTGGMVFIYRKLKTCQAMNF